MEVEVTDILVAVIAALAIGGVSGGLTAWLALRIRFERFVSMDDRREQNWNACISMMSKQLSVHSDDLKALATHEHRLTSLENKLEK